MFKVGCGFYLFIFGLVGTMISCKRPQEPVNGPHAAVMVVYACAQEPRDVLEVYINGVAKVGLALGTQDPDYMNLFVYSTDLDLSLRIQDTLFAETRQTVQLNKQYAYFLGGTQQNPCKIFMEDELPVADAGHAQLRFVNMSPDTTAFQCVVNGVVRYSGLSYQGFSGFQSTAGDTLCVVQFTNTAGTIVSVTDTISLIRGGIYSIVLSGQAGVANGLVVKKIYHNPVLVL
jgi:hypothetical protein